MMVGFPARKGPKRRNDARSDGERDAVDGGLVAVPLRQRVGWIMIESWPGHLWRR